MSFQVSPDYCMTENIQRLLGAQCRRAIHQLSRHGEDPHKSVHEARLSLKRARTLSMLLREQLGEKCYNDLSGRMRDLGQQLAAQRDDFIKARTVRELLELDQFELPASPLVRDYQQRDIERTLTGLSQLAARVEGLVIAPRGFAAISEAVLDLIRQENHAHLRAARTGRDKHYHAWRKRAKHVYHLISIMRPLRRDRLTRRRQDFYRLTQLLGDIQDLAIIAEDLDSLGLSARKSRLLEIRLADARKRTAHEAIYLGNEIAIEHPRDFVESLSKHWKRLRQG